MIDLATIAQPCQSYSECVSHHSIHIIATRADGSAIIHKSDFARKERHYRKGYDHNKREFYR